jgi:hypothetical protein
VALLDDGFKAYYGGCARRWVARLIAAKLAIKIRDA